MSQVACIVQGRWSLTRSLEGVALFCCQFATNPTTGPGCASWVFLSSVVSNNAASVQSDDETMALALACLASAACVIVVRCRVVTPVNMPKLGRALNAHACGNRLCLPGVNELTAAECRIKLSVEVRFGTLAVAHSCRTVPCEASYRVPVQAHERSASTRRFSAQAPASWAQAEDLDASSPQSSTRARLHECWSWPIAESLRVG